MDYELMFRYITKKATKEEIENFEEWLNSSESNRTLYKDWDEFWKLTGKSYSDFEPDIEKRWEEIKIKLTGNKKGSKVIRLMTGTWYRLAASILLFILLGAGSIAFFKSGMVHREKYLSYSSGNDTLNILLDDGSRISLNAHTILKIPKSFRKDNRFVRLEGEAFFKITHDPEHPFRVYADNTVTEVLGTTFNIKSREPEVRVTLVTGKVAFYNEHNTQQKLILRPGQHGVFNDSTGLFLKDTASNLNNIAWITKRLEFRQTPMNKLCQVLSAFYKKKIVLADKDKFQGNFTGIINHLSLPEATSIVELTMGVKAVQYSDSVVFFSEKNRRITPTQ